MKKLLAVSLVVIMVFAMFVPATVTAAGETVDERGTLAYSEYFDETGDAATAKAAEMTGKLSDATNTGDASFTVADGKLKADIPYAHPSSAAKGATRLLLYQIPDDVTEFSIEAKMTITYVKGSHGSKQYGGAGVVLSDDGSKLNFYMHLLEPYYTMRFKGWGNSTIDHWAQNEGETNAAAPLNEELIVKSTVSLVDETVNSQVIKASNGEVLIDLTAAHLVSGNNIGLFCNDGTAEFDYFEVYTKSEVVEVEEPKLVYEENFNDATKVDALEALIPAGHSNTTTLSIADGKLKTTTSYAHPKNGPAARLPLYDIPAGVTEYTIETKVSFSNWGKGNGGGQYAGVGVIYSDNKTANANTSAGEFHMFIQEPGYTDRFLGARGGNTIYRGTAASDIGDLSLSTIEVVIELTVNVALDRATVNVYYASNNELYYSVSTDGSAAGNTANNCAGLFFNDCYAEFDYVKVYTKGLEVTNEETTFTGTNALVGDMYGLKYSVAVADKDVNANNKITATFTMNGKTTDPVAVTNGFVEFYGIASQCMGDTITAKLYCDSVEVDSVNYTVAENLQTLAATNELARAALVYGAASQEYQNYGTPVTNVGVISFDKEDLTPTKNVVGGNDDVKFTGVGVYFDDTNKLYYLIEAPNGLEGVTVKVNGEARNIKHVEGTTYKVYSEELYANELLQNMVATIEVNGNEVHSLTYGVVDYVLAKCESTTPGLANLVKALYNYAVAAA